MGGVYNEMRHFNCFRDKRDLAKREGQVKLARQITTPSCHRISVSGAANIGVCSWDEEARSVAIEISPEGLFGLPPWFFLFPIRQ